MTTIMKTVSVLRVGRNTTDFASIVNGLHTSSAKYLNQYRRQQKGLPTNPNVNGPLVTLPDFSYRDNRPSPYGANQWKRIIKHQDYMKKVEKLVGEVDYAVERHKYLLKKKEEKRQKILDSKLKPKGQLLITDN
ncbi:mitochondrial ribosomal protein L52 [Augochlora pura]